MSDPIQPAAPQTPAAKEGTDRARPDPRPGKVPSLTPNEDFGRGPRLRDLDREIENELEAALGEFSGQELLGTPTKGKPQPAAGPPGKKIGKVFAVRGEDVFLDVPGGRSQGMLPLAQFPEGPPAVGTEVEIHIEGYDNANGLLLLTRKGAAVEADWSSVAEGQIVEARVTATNKGGLSVDVNGIRGFLPISQIDLFRVEETEPYVNQRLRCLVTEVNREERNLVVSRRALLEKEREDAREKLWQELAEGQIREGIVRSVREFGAFVDLGGVDGLLHISEMAWTRVKNAEDIVQPGQKVKVIVLKLDREARKVGLGMRQLTDSPWDNVDANYPVGEVVKGKVSRLAEFGAFVELEPAVEGLIHISELSHSRVRKPGDVVKVDQEVAVRVLNVDKVQRRISLSLKGAQLAEGEEPEETAAEEEVPEEVKPPRPRATPLRGGLGG